MAETVGGVAQLSSMKLIYALICFLIMQVQATDGLSQPPRSRKMLYGKSKIAFQPFAIKPDDQVDRSGGRRRERSRGTAALANTLQNDVADAAEDESTSAKMHESSGLNPIQALEKLNKQREKKSINEPSNLSTSKISSEIGRIALADTPITSISKPQLPQQQQQQQQQRTGSQSRDSRSKKPSTGLANIYWKAVDVEDLRLHPYFKRFDSDYTLQSAFCITNFTDSYDGIFEIIASESTVLISRLAK